MLPVFVSQAGGGHQVGERGYFYSPTVGSGLRQDDEMVQSRCSAR